MTSGRFVCHAHQTVRFLKKKMDRFLGLEWGVGKDSTMDFCVDLSFNIGVNTGEYKESYKQ